MHDDATSLTDRDIAIIDARLDRPIVLIGLPGVGKSTVGRRLAGLLNRNFADSDEEIEQAAQRTVSEIFEEFGESYFRDGERRVIARLIEDRAGVIATGGGAFADAETRALILKGALAIWLDCDMPTLVARVKRRDTRPLLRENVEERLLALHEARVPQYRDAPIHIRTGETQHRDTALRIIGAIERWL